QPIDGRAARPSRGDGFARPDERPIHVRRQAALEEIEEHTSELQSQSNLVCRLLLEKNKPEDFGIIEKKMREIVARDKPFSKEVWTLYHAKRAFRDQHSFPTRRSSDLQPIDGRAARPSRGDGFARPDERPIHVRRQAALE